MARRTVWIVALAAVIAATAWPGTLTAREQAPAINTKQLLGTWAAQIIIPPNPLMGNMQEVILFEYITFTKNGGLVATANFPYFPVPVGGKIKTAIVSVSHSSWRLKGGVVQGTNWRFLNSKKNGNFWGFMKNRVELHSSGPDSVEGLYFLELFTPALTPMRLGDSPAVLGPGVVRAVKVPVEAIQ
jgi:hypothetical protein